VFLVWSTWYEILDKSIGYHFVLGWGTGYGVQGPGHWITRGVENTGSGGKRGVYVALSKWNTRYYLVFVSPK